MFRTSGPLASTAIFKFDLQISKSHGPTKGEGEWGVRGLSSQGLLKGPLFLLPSLRKKKFYPLLLWAFDAHSPYLLNSNFSGFGDYILLAKFEEYKKNLTFIRVTGTHLDFQ